jgi:N utilization substance protein B
VTNNKVQKFSKNARIKARRSAVQAYYQWLLNQKPMEDIIKEFKTDRIELKKADIAYFESLLLGMVSNRTEIDTKLGPVLDRSQSDLDPVEYAILHLGIYELLFQKDIPPKVIVNEAVELAKLFGAEESHKYINGVVDKLAHQIRQSELLDC